MKVFISWSKSASQSVAEAFAAWLPRVIQECEPFISSDTEKGDAWFDTIEKNLAEARVGVLFLTPQNQNEPWLNYEAGALRTLRTGNMKRLCAVFVGMKTADYTGPLKNFQMTNFADKADMLKLIRAINGTAERPLEAQRLEEEFEEKWSRLVADTQDAVLDASAEGADEVPAEQHTRSAEDKLDEVLDVLREMRRERSVVSTGHKYRAQQAVREDQDRESAQALADSILGEYLLDESGNHRGEIVELSVKGGTYNVVTDEGFVFSGSEKLLRAQMTDIPF
ncbi:TIR domain-containing protein [Frigoribacterium sp. NBH87]|uniref:TIR domain-containing protein n=1 Tax=Frigoribacterium sp. NBH87 TaxID=2596916 RepID=UPI001626FB86|nr:TIR domain-containing protein [Frigoribacterium sp. NBH87]QNE44962.1 TIR domain-containing protein [Frigoribacterium sp. NBH87]